MNTEATQVEKSFKQKCTDAKIKYSNALSFRTRKRKLGVYLTDNEYINLYVEQVLENKQKTLAEKCKQEKVNYGNVMYHKHSKNISDEEAIEIVKNNNNKEKTISSMCKDLDTDKACAYRIKKNNPKLTNEQAVELAILHKRTGELKRKCENVNVNYSSVRTYMHRNKGVSVDDAIKHCVNKEKIVTLLEYSERFRLNIRKMYKFKAKHKELTNEQIVLYFKPDLHINLFGELVEIN